MRIGVFFSSNELMSLRAYDTWGYLQGHWAGWGWMNTVNVYLHACIFNVEYKLGQRTKIFPWYRCYETLHKITLLAFTPPVKWMHGNTETSFYISYCSLSLFAFLSLFDFNLYLRQLIHYIDLIGTDYICQYIFPIAKSRSFPDSTHSIVVLNQSQP